MRIGAWIAFTIVVAFVGATFVDSCPEEGGDDCPPACHFACLDGCSIAPVATSIDAPAATVVSHDCPSDPASRPLERARPPDLIPPRA